MFDSIIQKPIITLLNAVYSITCRIDKSKREAISFVLWFAIIFFMTSKRSSKLNGILFFDILATPFSQFFFSTMLFMIISFLAIDCRVKQIEWRKHIILLQILLGISIIIISFIHPVGSGYRLFGFQLMVVLPIYYIVWNNRCDYAALFRTVTRAMIFVGLLIFLFTICYALIGELDFENGTRLRGIMGNANCHSLVGLELFIGGLYLLLTEKKKLSNWILCYCSIGIGLGFIFTGQMRIAIIAVFVCAVVSIIYKNAYFFERINKKTLVRVVVGLIIVGFMVGIFYAAIGINNKISQSSSSTSEQIAKENSGITDRLIPSSGEGVEQFSSGRTWIWKNYYHKLNMVGNDYSKYNQEEMTGPHYGNAHNVFLEVSYRYGVPVGIAFLVYMFLCGVVCLRYLFLRDTNKKKFLLFPILTAIIFVLETILDCALLPFFQPEALIYYISLAAVVDKRL